MMRQVLEDEYHQAQAENRSHQEVGMIIRSDRKNLDQRRYNSPTVNEIAVIFKCLNGKPPSERDIRGHLLIPRRGKRFMKIDSQKPMCDSITYPLLFPNGKDGLHVNMPYTNTTRRERAGLDEGQDDEQPAHELNEEEEPICTFDRTTKNRHGSPTAARNFSV